MSPAKTKESLAPSSGPPITDGPGLHPDFLAHETRSKPCLTLLWLFGKKLPTYNNP